MALCFLMVRGKVDAPLRESAGMLLRYLPLMMVPIGVGIVKLVDAPPPGLWRLVVVLIVALVIGAVGTAKIMQGFLRWRTPAIESQPVTSERAD
jgi:holin-like protein